MSVFAGICPIIHVPFGAPPNEPIVLDELQASVDRLIRLGVDGIVALGLASEPWTLTEHERDEVVRAAVSATDKRVPVIVGIEGTTMLAVDRAARAQSDGASGVMAIPARGADPATVWQHFAAIANIGLPILIQDAPQVTGVQLPLDALRQIADSCPLARQVKSEGIDAGRKVSALQQAGIEVVAGWGGLNYTESLRRGVIGCFPGSDLGPALAQVHRAAHNGDWAAAEHIYAGLTGLLAWETRSLELLILGAKRTLQRAGIFSSQRMRAPGPDLDAIEQETLERLLDRLWASDIAGVWSDNYA